MHLKIQEMVKGIEFKNSYEKNGMGGQKKGKKWISSQKERKFAKRNRILDFAYSFPAVN